MARVPQAPTGLGNPDALLRLRRQSAPWPPNLADHVGSVKITGPSGGTALAVAVAGATKFSVLSTGRLKFETDHQAASATAGTSGALPAQAAGYFVVQDAAGATKKIPYFQQLTMQIEVTDEEAFAAIGRLYLENLALRRELAQQQEEEQPDDAAEA